MPNDPLAGRGLRAPERSRMLVATEDGIFLRPGAALAERRGNGFVAAEPREINSRIGALFGPEAIYLPVASAVEIACVHLRAGNRDAAQRALDRLALPPVSPNGARLLRAIAKRQGLATPVFAETTKQAGTIWTEDDVESFAALDDRLASRTRVLEKIFNPALAGTRRSTRAGPRASRMAGSFGRRMAPARVRPSAPPRQFFRNRCLASRQRSLKGHHRAKSLRTTSGRSSLAGSQTLPSSYLIHRPRR